VISGTKEGVERRRHQRIPVGGGTFVVLQPDRTKLGQVINIGVRGLAFRYMTPGEPWKGAVVLDLFVVGHDFYLEDLPFENVWDTKTGKVVPWGSTTLRRKGIQFAELAPSKQSQLCRFVRSQNPTMSLLTRQNS
jgi:hypothetical protein